MTRDELSRQVGKARTTAEANAWRDMLALVDLQRSLYGEGVESMLHYTVCGNCLETIIIKG